MSILGNPRRVSSIGVEALRRSFSISTKVSLVLFFILSLFLFVIQIKQLHQSIEQKLSIDSEFVVNAVKLGDRFFITKYLAAFVDSGAVKSCAIKRVGADVWTGAAPDISAAALLRDTDLHLDFFLGTIYGMTPMQGPQGAVWGFYFSYEMPYYFLFYAALISLVFSFIVFLLLYKMLKETAVFFSEPVENLNRDIDAQIGNPVGAFDPQNYKKGQQFKETDRFVSELNRLLEKMELQNAQIKDAEIHRALSRLGAQVNHDIQSPLGALRTAIEQIDANRSAALGLMKRSAARIQDIVADLKVRDVEVSGVKKRRSKVDICSYLKELLAEKEAEYGDSVRFHFTPSRTMISLEIDRVSISRVISNIINNGVEASVEEIAKIDVWVLCEDDIVRIAFCDNGHGVPTEIKNKIFEYGFSAGKAGGSGTGLSHGLSVMREHDGQLQLEMSDSGRLNSFVLVFPRPKN